MSFVRVIPCLDVKDGLVVKGTRFVSLRDVGDPVEFAERYERQGADELALLDITATVEKRATMVDVVRRVADSVSVPVSVGGGIKDISDIERLLHSGADKVIVNSAAVKNPELVREASEIYGSGRITVAIDVRRKPGSAEEGWEVVINGGRVPTGMDVLEWADRVQELGAGELLVTSMDTDGTKSGYDNVLNAAIASRVSIPVVASGGAGELEHIRDAVLEGRVQAVLAASIFHFNEYTVSDVKNYLKRFGIPVKI